MTVADTKKKVEALFEKGAHYAYPKARRHPSAKKFLFGAKNGVEIFDLEKTVEALEKAVVEIEKIAATGKKVLFVGGKKEAQKAVREIAESVNAPFVAGRWVGGTLSNFDIIKKRVEKLLTLSEEKEKGLLSKYTKKERLMIDREIKRLEEMFGGIKEMKGIPGALVIVDPKAEKIARTEANQLKVPVIALANSDCDLSGVKFPIPGNDANVGTITLVVSELAKAYKEGAMKAPKREVVEKKETVERAPRKTFKPRAHRA